MDEFINQFFSPTSWENDQTHGLGLDTGESYEGSGKNLPATFIDSSHMEDSLITESALMFVDDGTSFELDKNLLLGEPKYSLPGVMDVNSNSSYTDSQLNTPSTISTTSYHSPELLPFGIDPSTSPSVQPESASVGSNDSEPSGIQPTLRDSNSLNSIPQLWSPSSYRGVSSLPSAMVQDELQGLGLQGPYMETPAHFLGNNNFKDDHILQANLPGLQQNMNNHYLSSFADRYQIPQRQMQFSQLNEGNYIDESSISPLPHTDTAINGSVKPRVRARRGQATDPHSIAERLRREKIADRMKNLQELIPSSNKTDKASMLDEIIEYVKFLQLQVKVLSMSRLGAAGAVVPLITDSQAEGSTAFSLSPSANRGLDLYGSSSNGTTFEQEVVKLMEANMSKAIQFLQSKGLCLMPIALAAAINGSKSNKPIIKEEDGINKGNKTT